MFLKILWGVFILSYLFCTGNLGLSDIKRQPSSQGPLHLQGLLSTEGPLHLQGPLQLNDPLNSPFTIRDSLQMKNPLHFQEPLSDEGPLHLQIAIFRWWTPSHWHSVHNPQVCFNVTSITTQAESIRFRCRSTNHKLTSSQWTRLSDALADVMMIFVSLLVWTSHTFGGDTTETFLTFCFLRWFFFHVRSFLSFILCLLFLDPFSRHMILKCILHPISTKQITWANGDALQKIWYVFFCQIQGTNLLFKW